MTGRPAMFARCTGAAAALVVLALTLLGARQATGLHPISGRRFAEVMDVSGAAWLDRAERETEEAPDEALDLIGVKKGSSAADIGAGSGYMTVRLAKPVGANGLVYANER